MGQGYIPPRPEGSTPEARFAQWAWDTLTMLLRPLQVPGMKVSRTSRGFSMVPEAKSGGRTSPADPPQAYLVTEVHGDYLIGRDVTWTLEPVQASGLARALHFGDPVKIAKPWELRTSVAAHSVADIGFQFNYLDASTRTVSRIADGMTETQRIVPPYILPATQPIVFPGTFDSPAGAFIWAIPVLHSLAFESDGDPQAAEISLLDINVAGRVWATWDA